MGRGWTACQWAALLAATSASADPLLPGLADALGGARHDESLSRAARRHAATIAGGELDRDPLLSSRAAGLADAQLLPFAAKGDAVDAGRKALEFFAHSRPFGATHFGLGRSGAVLVVLASRRLIELPPLSPVARAGPARLAGVLSVAAPTRALLTLPTGDVERLEPRVKGRQVAIDVALDAGPGLYDVEILVETSRGPEVAALWRWAVGVPAATESAAPSIADLSALERVIGALRAAAQAEEVQRSEALDRAATLHAEATCQSGVAAHVPAPGDTPEARAAKAGWRGPVAENIAIAPTLGRAHANLLASPSHRSNLLAPARALGLGVVRQRDRVCLVELFGALSDTTRTAPR